MCTMCTVSICVVVHAVRAQLQSLGFLGIRVATPGTPDPRYSQESRKVLYRVV